MNACVAGVGSPDEVGGATESLRPEAACATDADCAEGTWCRPSSTGGATCHAYVGAHRSCGGFTLPENYEVCEPGLTCCTDPMIADLPGRCGVCCDAEGRPRRAGQSWTDGCNTCWCGDGGLVACTRMACAP